jgi:hypothetical protein
VVGLEKVAMDAQLYTMIGNKKFEVRKTNGKNFYFSRLAGRWLPVAQSKVIDEVEEALNDFNYVGSRHHY